MTKKRNKQRLEKTVKEGAKEPIERKAQQRKQESGELQLYFNIRQELVSVSRVGLKTKLH